MKPRPIVWIVNQYAGSPYHGMQFRPYYLGLELIKLGYEVYIIGASFSHQFSNPPKITGKYTIQEIDGLNYVWLKTNVYKGSESMGRIWSFFRYSWRLRAVPKYIGKTPDYIIVSSPSLFPIRKAIKWKSSYQCKVIFEVRDLWPLTLEIIGGKSKWHPFIMLLQAFENYAYRKADFVVSLLPGAFPYMEKHGLKQERFAYIPNGILPNGKVKGIGSAIKSLVKEDHFTNIYVGSIGLANALEFLIEAMNKLSNENIQLFVVGAGSHKGKLKENATNNKVHFIDPIPKNQVQDLLQYADLCYIGWRKSSLYKFGISANKIFEYMLARKPILHSGEVSKDIVELAQAGLTVRPEDPNAIQAAILKMRDMAKNERLELGNNGYKYVLEHHTYQKLAVEYKNLMEA